MNQLYFFLQFEKKLMNKRHTKYDMILKHALFYFYFDSRPKRFSQNFGHLLQPIHIFFSFFFSSNERQRHTTSMNALSDFAWYTSSNSWESKNVRLNNPQQVSLIQQRRRSSATWSELNSSWQIDNIYNFGHLFFII